MENKVINSLRAEFKTTLKIKVKNLNHRISILEELDYLCNLIVLKVSPHATSSDKDTSRSQD